MRSCRFHECNTILRDVHQWHPRILRGPPVGAFVDVVIYVNQLRAVCDFCDGNVRSAKVDFIHPQFQNMTLSMVEHAGRMMEEITCAADARLLRMKERTMYLVILDKKEVLEFRKALTLWYRLVRESTLKPFKDFAKTLHFGAMGVNITQSSDWP